MIKFYENHVAIFQIFDLFFWIITIISNLFTVDLTITITKYCKTKRPSKDLQKTSQKDNQRRSCFEETTESFLDFIRRSCFFSRAGKKENIYMLA